MNDIKNIKSLEHSNALIDRIIETVKCQIKKQEGEFLPDMPTLPISAGDSWLLTCKNPPARFGNVLLFSRFLKSWAVKIF